MQFCSDSEPEPEAKFERYEDLTVRLAPEHSLWSHVVWNSAKRLYQLIRAGAIDVRGRRVYELGCGAALPSLLAARLGAALVVAAEYPDKELLDNVAYNFDHNLSAEQRARVQVLGHVWGRPGPEGQFDLMFQTDLVFNHIEHQNLAREIVDHLKDDGVCHVLFTHHRPQYERKDMAFLDVCAAAGLKVVQRESCRMERMFPEDDWKYEIPIREIIKWYEVRKQ